MLLETRVRAYLIVCARVFIWGDVAVLDPPRTMSRSSALVDWGKRSECGPRELVFDLVALRVLVTVATAALAKFIYLDLILETHQPWVPYIWPTAILALIIHTVFRECKLSDFETLLAPRVSFGTMVGAVLRSVLTLIGILFIFKAAEYYSRGWLIIWTLSTIVGLIGVQLLMMRRAQRSLEAGVLRRRIAVIGTSDFVSAISLRLREEAPDYSVSSYSLSESDDEETIRSELAQLRSEVSRGFYDQVLVCGPGDHNPIVYRAICALSSCVAELTLCTDLRASNIPIAGQRDIAGLAVRIVKPVPPSERSWILKRSFDLVAAVLGLILLAPLFLIVALLIKLDSPGPVFFRQRRYGKNNSIFRIYKFRTMTVAEDGDQVVQATRNDARVTRVGRFLRFSSIDELPQLINVLEGTMSIVGPRPHALAHDLKFEESLDMFASRRRVLPGLTGWAQVNGYRGEIKTTDDIRRRMDHDLDYVDNWSIWFDIEIVTRTIITVFRGAY